MSLSLTRPQVATQTGTQLLKSRGYKMIATPNTRPHSSHSRLLRRSMEAAMASENMAVRGNMHMDTRVIKVATFKSEVQFDF